MSQTKIIKSKPYINKIVIKKIAEPMRNSLEDDFDFEGYPEAKDRVQRYYDGEWFEMGITAEAEIWKDYNNPNNKFSQIWGTVHSGGIWGIESDSEERYIKENIEEQIDELKEILKELNIEVPENVDIEEVEESE